MTTLYESPIGPLLIDCQAAEHPSEVVRWFDAYFAGKRPAWLPTMHLSGTPFQKRVWQLLTTIPYGTTTTYGALARSLSPTMSAQAVGQAIHRNPCCILIPCHRVVGADGSLTGYAYGLEMKQALLHFEQRTL